MPGKVWDEEWRLSRVIRHLGASGNKQPVLHESLRVSGNSLIDVNI